MWKSKIPTKLKEKFYCFALWPTILYRATKIQYTSMLSVPKVRMLRWICGKSSWDRIRNKSIYGIVSVALVKDKNGKNRLRSFEQVYFRLTDAVVGRSGMVMVMVEGNTKGRGRLKLT